MGVAVRRAWLSTNSSGKPTWLERPLAFPENPAFERQIRRALSQVPGGGSQIGEVLAVASRIDSESLDSWHDEWSKIAKQMVKQALSCERDGHKVSSREAFLRACEYFRQAEFFLKDKVNDPRCKEASARIQECFLRATGLRDDVTVTPLSIPYQGTYLSGYYCFPNSHPIRTQYKGIIMQGGADSFCVQLYCTRVKPALKRGYNVLIFDGPGQGHVLREQGLFLRPDWNVVVDAVVSFALKYQLMDPSAIALMGYGELGGLLAGTAAAHNSDIAALVMDPGVVDLSHVLHRLGVGSALQAGDIQSMVSQVEEKMATMHPALVASLDIKMTALGASSVEDFLVNKLPAFSLKAQAENISAASLICDPLGESYMYQGGEQRSADVLFDLLPPKHSMTQIVSFSEEEGGGDSCEWGSPCLFTNKAYDWLDDVLALAAKSRPQVPSSAFEFEHGSSSVLGKLL